MRLETDVTVVDVHDAPVAAIEVENRPHLQLAEAASMRRNIRPGLARARPKLPFSRIYAPHPSFYSASRSGT
jgi:hypothetical protein